MYGRVDTLSRIDLIEYCWVYGESQTEMFGILVTKIEQSWRGWYLVSVWTLDKMPSLLYTSQARYLFLPYSTCRKQNICILAENNMRLNNQVKIFFLKNLLCI